MYSVWSLFFMLLTKCPDKTVLAGGCHSFLLDTSNCNFSLSTATTTKKRKPKQIHHCYCCCCAVAQIASKIVNEKKTNTNKNFKQYYIRKHLEVHVFTTLFNFRVQVELSCLFLCAAGVAVGNRRRRGEKTHTKNIISAITKILIKTVLVFFFIFFSSSFSYSSAPISKQFCMCVSCTASYLHFISFFYSFQFV